MRQVPINPTHSPFPRSAPRAPPGVLSHWIVSLSHPQRTRLFDRLIRADVALASSLAEYERTARVPRLCLLLMNECAIARSLHVGELALLFPSLEEDAVLALDALARDHDAKADSCERGEQHANTR